MGMTQRSFKKPAPTFILSIERPLPTEVTCLHGTYTNLLFAVTNVPADFDFFIKIILGGVIEAVIPTHETLWNKRTNVTGSIRASVRASPVCMGKEIDIVINTPAETGLFVRYVRSLYSSRVEGVDSTDV